MPDSPFLFVREVAALLRQPVSWVYERSRMGEIPHYKAGKRLEFDREEVLAWFREAHKRGPVGARLGVRARVPNNALGSRRGRRAGLVRGSAHPPSPVAP